MNKPTVVEIPQNANDQVVRYQIEEIQRVIRLARLTKKDRVRVTIQQQTE